MIIKTFTFGLVHIAVAFMVVYLLTGSALTGGIVAAVEPACNLIAYHFHEKAWDAWRKRGRLLFFTPFEYSGKV